MPTLFGYTFGREPAPQKASTGGTGAGVLAFANDVPLWSASRNHNRLMRQAQELYHSDLIIRACENKVAGRAASLPWHLEDENDDEVGDDSPPEQKAIRDWLERPQMGLPDRKQMGRRDLWKLTHRHNGLCGTAFWYLDQRTFTAGVPLATLYINPARMYPVQDKNGTLLGWKLDADDEGNGGLPLGLEEVLQFVYDPPDYGHFGIGLVEAAGMVASLSRSVDRHTASVLGAGGRMAGLISPKPGTVVSQDQWAAAVRDWRNIAGDNESAKRLHILQAPVDFTRTAATMQELAIEAVSRMAREDKLALWGVPESQLPLPTPVGLNGGATKGYDEAILMQGAVHDRVTPFWEVIQYQVLDRIAERGGPKLELHIEEPTFDDESPKYAIAAQARELPLTNNQRLALIGHDPLPDYDLSGNPLGTAIYLPATLTVVGAGPDANGKLEPPPAVTPFPPAVPPLLFPAKAKTLAHLRAGLEMRYTPAVRKSVERALSQQARAIAERVRAKGAHIAAKPTDSTVWWNQPEEEARLRRAIQPHALSLVEDVTANVGQIIDRPKKADTFAETVQKFVSDRGGERIVGILETTREAINRLIFEGFAAGLGPAEVADSILGSATFDEARAEMIARTEMALAYNEASLRSFEELGVTEVEAIDGDQDEECAARNGQIYTLADSYGITDHPNGTLDWAPVIG